MGQFDFTYELPNNFNSSLIQFLQQNRSTDVAQAFQRCKYEYQDLGLAYYAGLRGDTWDKKAVDFTFEGSEKDISLLKSRNEFLKKIINKALKPSVSGYLVKEVYYIISDDDFKINLPEEQGETFEILSRDIYDVLSKDEPTLVLDRLHTYSTRFLRNICNRHNIPVADEKGNNYPLHNLAGALSKYYEENNVFQSDFVVQTLKMSISTFEKYNKIRNSQSYAHDNNVLNKSEATYVVTIITATLTLIHKIENQ